jgi:hypothetical protein
LLVQTPKMQNISEGSVVELHHVCGEIERPIVVVSIYDDHVFFGVSDDAEIMQYSVQDPGYTVHITSNVDISEWKCATKNLIRYVKSELEN